MHVLNIPNAIRNAKSCVNLKYLKKKKVLLKLFWKRCSLIKRLCVSLWHYHFVKMLSHTFGINVTYSWAGHVSKHRKCNLSRSGAHVNAPNIVIQSHQLCSCTISIQCPHIIYMMRSHSDKKILCNATNGHRTFLLSLHLIHVLLSLFLFRKSSCKVCSQWHITVVSILLWCLNLAGLGWVTQTRCWLRLLCPHNTLTIQSTMHLEISAQA